MGTSAKAGDLFQLYSSKVNSRMILWRTPLGWTLWILGGRGGQHALQILLLARFWRSKSMKGATIERRKKFKKSNRNIKNRDAPTLKLATNGLEVFVNSPWASFCAMYFLSNINLRLLLMHKYCNQFVTRFFTIFDRYTIYCISIALHIFSSVLVRLCCHCFCLMYYHLKYIYICIFLFKFKIISCN